MSGTHGDAGGSFGSEGLARSAQIYGSEYGSVPSDSGEDGGATSACGLSSEGGLSDGRLEELRRQYDGSLQEVIGDWKKTQLNDVDTPSYGKEHFDDIHGRDCAATELLENTRRHPKISSLLNDAVTAACSMIKKHVYSQEALTQSGGLDLSALVANELGGLADGYHRILTDESLLETGAETVNSGTSDTRRAICYRLVMYELGEELDHESLRTVTTALGGLITGTDTFTSLLEIGSTTGIEPRADEVPSPSS